MRDLTPFRVGYVPGVMPGKWQRIWAERFARPLELAPTEVSEQLARLRDGALAMCLARGELDGEGAISGIDAGEFHLIPLYREQPVVVAAADHPVAAYPEIDIAELGDEHDVLAANPGIAVRAAIETVAAGTGIVVVPMSLARLHYRKDAVWRPVLGVPESPVGLAWLKEPPSDLDERARDQREESIQAFIGVVRGRTANSSRG